MYVICASWEAFHSCQEVKIVKLMHALFFFFIPVRIETKLDWTLSIF